MNLLQNFHIAVIEYLYHGRRVVLLQMFTTRHSNRKLSIVMALSTTFMHCAPETTKFCKIMQNKGHYVVQGHSESHILVPIKSSTFLSQTVHVYLQPLLTTVTSAPRKLPSSVKKRKVWAISPFKVIQGHRFWYQSKAHIRLPISD